LLPTALGSKKITEKDLLEGKRIVERIERHIASSNIKLRPTAGYNHYVPAKALLLTKLVVDNNTLERFAALFKDINRLFSKKKD
jgi:hypothetical protein